MDFIKNHYQSFLVTVLAVAVVALVMTKVVKSEVNEDKTVTHKIKLGKK